MLKFGKSIQDIKDSMSYCSQYCGIECNQGAMDLKFQASLMGALTRGRCSGGVLRERCFEDMKQIYRKYPCRGLISAKLLYHSCAVSLQHNFGRPFSKGSNGVI